MRTGTSWLCTILNSHPDIDCRQEILHYTKYKGKMGSAKKFIESHFTGSIKTHRGFKILYHQMRSIDSIAYHTLKYYINDVYKCKVIHIVRDELDIFVSHRRAKRSKLWNILDNGGQREIVADVKIANLDEALIQYNQPVHIDIEEFKLFLSRYRQWKDEIKRSFNPIEVNYSQLPDIKSVLSALGLPIMDLVGNSVKLSRSSIEDSIINYDEVYKLLYFTCL